MTTATPAMLEPDAILYKPIDLIVGSTVNVLGREVYLYDCDDFTRNFYEKYLDMRQSSIPIEAEKMDRKQMGVAPHTGFGSAEDSLANCLSLRPKPPRQDLVKLMTNSDKVLRFEARMDNKLPEDKARRDVPQFTDEESVAPEELRTLTIEHLDGALT